MMEDKEHDPSNDNSIDNHALSSLDIDDNSDFNPNQPKSAKRPIRKAKPKSKSLVLVMIVLIVVIVAGGGFFLLTHKKDIKKPAKSSSALSVAPLTSSTKSSTATYTANGSDLNLSFSYPSNWSVSPPTNTDTSNATITATSPLESITAADGSSADGKIIVSIRSGSATVNELNANSPTTAQASTQISYTAPTANQLQYPYVTFVHFSNGSSVANSFEEVIVTGGVAYAAATPLTAADLSGVDPIISASFTKCASEACTGSSATPLGISATTWQNATIFQQTLTLLESMKLN